jgi:hypothetical protein
VAIYDLSIQPQIVQQIIDSAGNDPVARRLALRDAVIGWSAGLPIGSGVSSLLQQGVPWSQPGNAGMRIALDLAAARGSKGEVALLSAYALQGEDPISANVETLITAIRALRRVGLESGARDVARDYLLANYVTLPAQRPAQRVRAPVGGATPPRTQGGQPATPTRPAARTPQSEPPPPPSPPAASPTRAKPTWGTP